MGHNMTKKNMFVLNCRIKWQNMTFGKSLSAYVHVFNFNVSLINHMYILDIDINILYVKREG